MSAETPVMVDLNKMRQIFVVFIDNSTRSYYMMDDQVQMFLQAMQDLHGVGINPHSKLESVRAIKAYVMTLGFNGPFWWTSPGLEVGKSVNDPKIGAKIIGQTATESIWEFSPEAGLRPCSDRYHWD